MEFYQKKFALGICEKYRANAAAATATAAATNPTTTTGATTSAPTADADELLTGGTTEVPPPSEIPLETNKNRPLPVDLTEKMNKLRDALVMARTTITAQQSRMTQMTNELARAKQTRISNDLTEAHTLIESIRQIYEAEINDLKHIIQLFDNIDSNEHMAEILRLRKRIDELTTNKSSTSSSSNTSSTTKQSEDVTSKSLRPQAFTASLPEEPVISRVVPMAPSSGRQIGVAIPMTASTTSTTTSASLWTGANTTETTTAPTTVVDHPTPQITTAAGTNLLMKRTRADDNDHKSTESTLKRSKPETETTPLIAHVEPQVREQQIIPIQEQQETMETNVLHATRTETSTDNEGINSSVEETISTDQTIDTESRSNTVNTLSTSVVTVGDTTITTTTTTESTNITTVEQTSDQRRGDILPIVYDVQSIPTIGSGVSPQIIRGGIGRQRPFMSISATRRLWSVRGGPGGGRGSLGGRGAGGVGPSARQ
ncbi:unnamed protein product [Rotaria sp. Silwood2]|nr:unnamed protein product [Rotaria sp. Silwood2]